MTSTVHSGPSQRSAQRFRPSLERPHLTIDQLGFLTVHGCGVRTHFGRGHRPVRALRWNLGSSADSKPSSSVKFSSPTISHRITGRIETKSGLSQKMVHADSSIGAITETVASGPNQLRDCRVTASSVDSGKADAADLGGKRADDQDDELENPGLGPHRIEDDPLSDFDECRRSPRSAGSKVLAHGFSFDEGDRALRAVNRARSSAKKSVTTDKWRRGDRSDMTTNKVTGAIQRAGSAMTASLSAFDR